MTSERLSRSKRAGDRKRSSAQPMFDVMRAFLYLDRTFLRKSGFFSGPAYFIRRVTGSGYGCRRPRARLSCSLTPPDYSDLGRSRAGTLLSLSA